MQERFITGERLVHSVFTIFFGNLWAVVSLEQLRYSGFMLLVSLGGPGLMVVVVGREAGASWIGMLFISSSMLGKGKPSCSATFAGGCTAAEAAALLFCLRLFMAVDIVRFVTIS